MIRKRRSSTLPGAYNPSYKVTVKGSVVSKNKPLDTTERILTNQKTFFTTTSISRVVLSENVKRKQLLIQNKTTSSIFVEFGKPATSDSKEIYTLGSFSSVAPGCSTDSVHVISPAAVITEQFNVTETY